MKTVAAPARATWLACVLAASLASWPGHAEDAPRKLVEIYRIAPGQHEAFLRMIALFDQASKEAGIRRATSTCTRMAPTGISC